MISIFSTYEPIIGKDCEEIKPSEVYNRLRIAYNQGAKGILNNTRMFLRTVDECDTLYKIWENKDLQKLCNWAMEKIVLQIGKISYQTIDVRLRIFATRLDKLPLYPYETIEIHNTFVENVRREASAVNTEDLPF